jgi:nucleoside triphosphate diphosphatase
MSRAAEQLEALLTLMRTLRDPEGGCPWDRAQTFETIAPYTIEEAYEVADAIARADLHRLCDELGDLLFQVVFHARMAEERGQFDFADVAQGIREKLVRRHPHVFGAAAPGGDMAALHLSWESQKASERAARGAGGVLADVPAALPALTRAAKLGKRAGRVGFDWDGAPGVRAKIDEELAELDRATEAGRKDEIAEELGDLLFTIANWARHLDLDAEQALRAASLKFERRFECMENQAQRTRLRLETLSAAQWEQLWAAAKLLNHKR